MHSKSFVLTNDPLKEDRWPGMRQRKIVDWDLCTSLHLLVEICQEGNKHKEDQLIIHTSSHQYTLICVQYIVQCAHCNPRTGLTMPQSPIFANAFLSNYPP